MPARAIEILRETWTSLREYGPAVFWGTLYTIVLGGGGAIAGWAFNLGLKPEQVPPSGWLGLIAVGFAFAQFQMFHAARLERDRLRSRLLAFEEVPRPDMYLGDALDYLLHRSAWGHGKQATDVFSAIREAASLEQITVWGRHWPDRPPVEDRPLMQMRGEYWRNHNFDETVVLAERNQVQRVMMTRDDQSRTGEYYYDLHLSAVQLRLRWPE